MVRNGLTWAPVLVPGQDADPWRGRRSARPSHQSVETWQAVKASRDPVHLSSCNPVRLLAKLFPLVPAGGDEDDLRPAQSIRGSPPSSRPRRAAALQPEQRPDGPTPRRNLPPRRRVDNRNEAGGRSPRGPPRPMALRVIVTEPDPTAFSAFPSERNGMCLRFRSRFTDASRCGRSDRRESSGDREFRGH
jgi:hypothetical protein